MIKVRLEITHDSTNEDRYYYRTVEMDFIPPIGTDMEFCECCSGEKVTDLKWNHATQTMTVGMETGDIIRSQDEHAERYHHWGFTEDRKLRGACRGPITSAS